MAKRRINKYSRRTAHSANRRKKSLVIICVIVFLLLCFLVSVSVGMILSKKVDEVKDKPDFQFEKYEYDSGNKVIRNVEAYYFEKGASPIDYKNQGINDFSICLRNSDGSLNYVFAAAEKLGLDEISGKITVNEISSLVGSVGGYRCAYIYINSFSVEDETLREVYKAYELALISEAADAAIDDILLVGMDIDRENIDEIESFVARASSMAEHTSLGVMIDKETILLTEDEIYLAGRIKNVCDYLAVDLTHLSMQDAVKNSDGKSNLYDEISQIEYYVKAYEIRVVFDRGNSNLYKEALAIGIKDFQVIEN